MFFVVDDDTMFRITVTWGELFDKIIETPGKRRCGPWSTTQRRRRRKKAMCNATMLKLLYNMEMKEEGTKEVTHRAGSYWTSCEYLDDASLQMLNHETKLWKRIYCHRRSCPCSILGGPLVLRLQQDCNGILDCGRIANWFLYEKMWRRSECLDCSMGAFSEAKMMTLWSSGVPPLSSSSTGWCRIGGCASDLWRYSSIALRLWQD